MDALRQRRRQKSRMRAEPAQDHVAELDGLGCVVIQLLVELDRARQRARIDDAVDPVGVRKRGAKTLDGRGVDHLVESQQHEVRTRR